VLGTPTVTSSANRVARRGIWPGTCCVALVTQSERQEAFFAKAERAHRAAMDQLRQDKVYGSASTWREAYVAAFSNNWFTDGATQPVSVTNDELLELVIGERRCVVE
jgi:hypothetical protein